jgi:hypothetical protein
MFPDSISAKARRSKAVGALNYRPKMVTAIIGWFIPFTIWTVWVSIGSGCEVSVNTWHQAMEGQKFVQGNSPPFTEFKPIPLISNDMVRSKQKKPSLSKTELFKFFENLI